MGAWYFHSPSRLWYILDCGQCLRLGLSQRFQIGRWNWCNVHIGWKNLLNLFISSCFDSSILEEQRMHRMHKLTELFVIWPGNWLFAYSARYLPPQLMASTQGKWTRSLGKGKLSLHWLWAVLIHCVDNRSDCKLRSYDYLSPTEVDLGNKFAIKRRGCFQKQSQWTLKPQLWAISWTLTNQCLFGVFVGLRNIRSCP